MLGAPSGGLAREFPGDRQPPSAGVGHDDRPKFPPQALEYIESAPGAVGFRNPRRAPHGPDPNPREIRERPGDAQWR